MTSTDRPAGGRPRLFVHVGIHKTGTTSLQGYLARHRDALAKAGLFVPKTGTLPQPGAGHHLLPWTLTGRHADQWAGVDPDGLWRTLAHELAASGCDHAIVSSEDLSHLTDEQVGIVAERLAPFDPVAVVVLRRPGDVLEGSFRTSVVIGGRDDFATYSAGYAPDYPGMLRRFAGPSPTGDLRIASYDDPVLSGTSSGPAGAAVPALGAAARRRGVAPERGHPGRPGRAGPPAAPGRRARARDRRMAAAHDRGPHRPPPRRRPALPGRGARRRTGRGVRPPTRPDRGRSGAGAPCPGPAAAPGAAPPAHPVRPGRRDPGVPAPDAPAGSPPPPLPRHLSPDHGPGGQAGAGHIDRPTAGREHRVVRRAE
jgi:hypothetical protein